MPTTPTELAMPLLKVISKAHNGVDPKRIANLTRILPLLLLQSPCPQFFYGYLYKHKKKTVQHSDA